MTALHISRRAWPQTALEACILLFWTSVTVYPWSAAVTSKFAVANKMHNLYEFEGEGVPTGKYQPLCSPRGWGEHSAMLCMKTTGYQYRYSFMTIPLKCLRAEYFPLDADLTQSISLPSPYS